MLTMHPAQNSTIVLITLHCDFAFIFLSSPLGCEFHEGTD